MSGNDEMVTVLEADWPNYQIWTVDRAVSKPRILWCARRWDSSGHTLNADSAAALVRLLEAEAEK